MNYLKATALPFFLFFSSCGLQQSTSEEKSQHQLSIHSLGTPVQMGAIWKQQTYIKASNSDSFDFFGASVALDGNFLVVGSSNEDSNQTTVTNGSTSSTDNSASNSGAAFVYKRNPLTNQWIQEAYLKSPVAETNDFFADYVAISGDTIAVGAGDDSNSTTIINGPTASADNSFVNAGAVHVFRRDSQAGTWAQEAYLKPSNMGTVDRFGYRLDIHKDTIVVGSYLEDCDQTTVTQGALINDNNLKMDSGAAYVFKRDPIANTWSQEAYLKADELDTLDRFGYSVAVFGDYAAVGAIYEDSSQTTITNGSTASSDDTVTNSGAVYIFKRDPITNTWSQTAYLKAPNTEADDYFGVSLALNHNTLVVGAYGEDSNQNTVSTVLSGFPDPTTDDDSLSNSGAAYVYRESNGVWSLEAYIKSPNPGADDWFGYHVDIDGNRIVVGSYSEDGEQTFVTNEATVVDSNLALGAGAAYVFKRNEVDNTWVHESYLKTTNHEGGDAFGWGVTIDRGTVVVGAYGEDGGLDTISSPVFDPDDDSAVTSGAAYVFSLPFLSQKDLSLETAASSIFTVDPNFDPSQLTPGP